MFDIYVIENSLNGKKYVGYTSKGYQKRFLEHLNESIHGSSRYLCRAIRKYGKDVFTVERIDTAETHEEATKKEIEYIKQLNSFAHEKGSNGYNATLGGEGVNGRDVPRSIRQKMSKLKKEQQAWVGVRNPKYNKGSLISGEQHPMYGKLHSSQTKSKISRSNKGRLSGMKNPSAKLLICYSLEHKTGEILKFESFFDLRKHFEEIGLKLNRSSILGIMRGDYGHKSYHGHSFYREDVTPIELFKNIESKYQAGITEPIEQNDYRQGKTHPNAKSVTCFAEDIKIGSLIKFNSWFELKQGIEAITQKKMTYSNMFKCLTGKYKHVLGYKLYREDETDPATFNAVLNKFNKQTEPSTTSRKA